jgi:hypothetical protein
MNLFPSNDNRHFVLRFCANDLGSTIQIKITTRVGVVGAKLASGVVSILI